MSLALLWTLSACHTAPSAAVASASPSAVPSPAITAAQTATTLPPPAEAADGQEEPEPPAEEATPSGEPTPQPTETEATPSGTPTSQPATTESSTPKKTASSAYSVEALDQKISDILDSIITDDMTTREQARAVFDYVKKHIRFVGSADKSDWQKGAYEGLTKGRGDCFTYYAVSRAMLTALEIDNLLVQRSGGTSNHYWNLVNCGDGWYHFDTCPRKVSMDGFDGFMFTDEDAANYSALRDDIPCYYSFDPTLYPERAGAQAPQESPDAQTAETPPPTPASTGAEPSPEAETPIVETDGPQEEPSPTETGSPVSEPEATVSDTLPPEVEVSPQDP